MGPRVVTRPVPGYKGTWYSNQPSMDEYKFKYSGGLGTYSAKHVPLAIHAPEVQKTFFCYGGASPDGRSLLHMISYYDHETGLVPMPRMLLDKGTNDAHDNPVLSIDGDGHVWIFSSSHGVSRPSYIHKSVHPHDITEFELVETTNFSYPQPWFVRGHGFLFLHTRYVGGKRCLTWKTSPDGRCWGDDEWLGGIEQGHYQVSSSWPSGKASTSAGGKVATAFNYHPAGGGLNARTNLYYLETSDMGTTWHALPHRAIEVPVLDKNSHARVYDFEHEQLLVYLKDLTFDNRGNPVILCMLSHGYESGPQDLPRQWTTVSWDGTAWAVNPCIPATSNYDTGCLHVSGDEWQLVAPTTPGPQPFNPGGEMAVWQSTNRGESWREVARLTSNSEYNHTYARRPVNAHPGFHAFWADGNPRAVSPSRLYFFSLTDMAAYRLPFTMNAGAEPPVALKS